MALKAGRKGVFAFRQKTAAQTEQAGIDAQGRVWYEGGSYTLPVATASTLGGVKVATATEAQTEDVGIDENGKLKTKPQGSYTLPVASPATLGGVKPVAKTSAMTTNVGVDENGALFAEAGETGGLEQIWVNPNQEDSFNAGDVTSSKITTNGVYIICFASSSVPWDTNGKSSSEIVDARRCGGRGTLFGFTPYSYQSKYNITANYRHFTISNGKITFETGYTRHLDETTAPSSGAQYAVPLAIYRIN